MSVLFAALESLEKKEGKPISPWNNSTLKMGKLAEDLPQEMLTDFYDLREHVRIASMRNQMRLISVASSMPGEGSTTISAYLAYLLAGSHSNGELKPQPELAAVESGAAAPVKKDKETLFRAEFTSFFKEPQKAVEEEAARKTRDKNDVLVIDANMHQPGLHRFFGLEQEHGLADIIEKRISWQNALKGVKNSSLYVITAGKSKTHAADLFASDEFRTFLKNIRDEFRFVLFDSSSILTFVDSLSLAAMIDGVILVVRAGQTRWELAQNAKRRLTVAHANLLGVALNRMKSIVNVNETINS
jgi:capsular exopolysaccharide synthesis family protein